MKIAIVKSSDLGKYNRMDAEFFIALEQVKARYLQLQQSMTAEEATAILHKMRPKDLAPCLVLARGTFVGKTKLEAVIREYPHLALALVEPTLETVVASINDEIQRNKEYLELLTRISPPGQSSNSTD